MTDLRSRAEAMTFNFADARLDAAEVEKKIEGILQEVAKEAREMTIDDVIVKIGEIMVMRKEYSGYDVIREIRALKDNTNAT